MRGPPGVMDLVTHVGGQGLNVENENGGNKRNPATGKMRASNRLNWGRQLEGDTGEEDVAQMQ